jgi:hypothetical protein
MKRNAMRGPETSHASQVWTKFATGETALKPGAGYWVGIGRRRGRFKVSAAYGETVVGHYVVCSEKEAARIQQVLLSPRPDAPASTAPGC